jgi:phosphotransferase system enzyme I (PtsP)
MSRRLLARLRDLMARSAASLSELAAVIAAEMVSEVCSIYALRPGEVLELVATHGLRPEAVGRTRLRIGEGLVGLSAATGEILNLPDAQNHPAFAYRPETGEEPFAALLAVPVRRAGRMLGVVVVQNRAARLYAEDEAETLETVAMLLAEPLAAMAANEVGGGDLATTLPRHFVATALVAGLIVGPVVVHGLRPAPTRLLADDPPAEQARFEQAATRMLSGLDQLMVTSGDHPAAAVTRDVLQAYRLIAEDAGWLRRVAERIATGLSAEAAIERAASEVRERMRRITDPYLRERLADIEDLAERLRAALDAGAPTPPVPPGAILLARRLGPAHLLDWHARGIAGVVVEEASAAGHAAIIARALSLPMLGGARGVMAAAESGDLAILDGEEGQLILRPPDDVRRAYQRAARERAARARGFVALARTPAQTRDGTPFRLMINAGLTQELAALDAIGAEGIGLFRTEIAMLARGRMLDVAEQAALYSRVLDAAAGRPVLFRTLDLGGDKLLPEADTGGEENPAMGWRSIRVGLDRPAILRRQLRALLLAAAGRPLSVMFPMVATLGEFLAVKRLLLAERERVRQAPARLSIGSMIEVPALLWQTDELLAAADFVSIGSNDLMQFLFAADRGASALAGRYDVLSPPVLALLAALARRAEAAMVPLSLCGEAAGEPLVALVLVALGITTLSMNAAALVPVKAALTAVDLNAFRAFLAMLRRQGSDGASLRSPLDTWAREHDVPV